jgi:CRISPR-associated protein Cas2
MFVIVTYDVPTGRTEIFRKILSRYLVHEQASVFAGALTETSHRKMLADLGRAAHPEDGLLQFLVTDRHNLVAKRLTMNPGNGGLQCVVLTRHGSNSLVV